MARTPRRLALAWLAVAATVAGCASSPPQPGDTEWLAGRLSLRVAATPDQALRQFSSAFELQGSEQRGELRLLSPLGNVAAAARWGSGGAVLRSSEGEQTFPDLATLSQQALGEALPLQALPAWLRGQAWPGAASTRTAQGFEQLGWQVQTTGLAEGRVDIGRAQAPAVQLRVRLDRPG